MWLKLKIVYLYVNPTKTICLNIDLSQLTKNIKYNIYNII